MPQPDELRALMARHDLKTSDIALIAGVNPATAQDWVRSRGPRFKPCPADAWARIKAAVGE